MTVFVQLVICVVCLFTRPDWATAKSVLGDAKFLSKLMEYNKVLNASD